VHHIAFWVDQTQDVLRGADVLLDYGLPIEFGPGRHGMGEISYIYFREPAGARVELNSGGYRNYEPDLETVHWIPAQGSNDWYRTSVMPESMGECFPAASDRRVDWQSTTPFGAVDRA
jgi:catechol 2,3-dioxygenase